MSLSSCVSVASITAVTKHLAKPTLGQRDLFGLLGLEAPAYPVREKGGMGKKAEKKWIPKGHGLTDLPPCLKGSRGQ